MNRGVVYFAAGKSIYFKEANYSAKTFKKYNKNIPVCLITNNASSKDINKKYYSKIIEAPQFSNVFKQKVWAIANTPYNETIFIDTDTQINDNIAELLDFLQFYDFAIAPRSKCQWGKETKFLDFNDESAFNTGIFSYRKNEKTIPFLTNWVEEVNKIPDNEMRGSGGLMCDQKIFNRLVFEENAFSKHNINLLQLPNTIYNCRPWPIKRLKDENRLQHVKILHFHGLNENWLIKKFNSFQYIIKNKLKN
nr:putative nucleotide-diphospho-sugar transferase [uncultured Carboxylicivirga sp.]